MHLTIMEEKELVQWTTSLTATGYAPRHATLREMAKYPRSRHVISDLAIFIEPNPLQQIRDSWMHCFLSHHPELASVQTQSIEATRVKDTSHERLSQWFNDINDAILKYNIVPENMYNMNESGFAISKIEASK